MVTLDRQLIIRYNHFLLQMPQTNDVVESNCKEILDLLVVFEFFRLFGILDHTILPALVDLYVDLPQKKLWTSF